MNLKLPRIIIQTQNLYTEWRDAERVADFMGRTAKMDYTQAIAKTWREASHD